MMSPYPEILKHSESGADWPELWLQTTKSWLIFKENKLKEAVQVFGGTNVQISTEGKRHLGAVTGTEENKKNYINDKISEWTKEINMLANIATTHPQAAYTVYVTTYQQKS